MQRPKREIKLPVRYKDGEVTRKSLETASAEAIVNALASETVNRPEQDLGFDPDEPTVEQAATTKDWPEWSVAIHE
jgi:hypothetical protein